MKLFLIPITKQRTLVYAQRISKATTAKPSLIDRASMKASMTWQQWEHGEKQWQRSLVQTGNKLFRRISYEEWGLKSVPSLSTRKKEERLHDTKIGVIYPPSVINAEEVPSIIQQLATERVALHRTRLWWSIIGMPIVAPFALVPVIPNIPFIYLAFRAYSHFKALAGGKHLEFLVKNNLLLPAPSVELDAIYNKGRVNSTEKAGTGINPKSPDTDSILINESDAQRIATVLQVSELAGELERAYSQVQRRLLETRSRERQQLAKQEL